VTYDARKDKQSQMRQMLMQALMQGGMGGGASFNPASAQTPQGLIGMMAPGAAQPNRMGMAGMVPGDAASMVTAGASPDVLKMLMASFGGGR
jgi:hypothetical protein